MSTIYYDPDEWETVYTTRSLSGYRYTQRRRTPEEVAKIKSETQRTREDAILAEADAIRAARGYSHSHTPGAPYTLFEGPHGHGPWRGE